MLRWLLTLGIIISTSAWSGVDLVKVDKSKRRMYLMDNGEVVREYRIALGARPKGHKQYEGDQRTPEGRYFLDFMIEDSQFYKSIHITYPNFRDIAEAQRRNLDPGGEIKIHGFKNGDTRPTEFVQSFDWTNGCIAITNQEMDELISLISPRTPIDIYW